ncbi:uncharacterized protein [Diabrotica undecimpunctata]|uniref:uncharacterized protein n=1 Tax=Diabrotica undecimpunctata TaxID=50387 RepID=UPI003B633710
MNTLKCILLNVVFYLSFISFVRLQSPLDTLDMDDLKLITATLPDILKDEEKFANTMIEKLIKIEPGLNRDISTIKGPVGSTLQGLSSGLKFTVTQASSILKFFMQGGGDLFDVAKGGILSLVKAFLGASMVPTLDKILTHLFQVMRILLKRGYDGLTKYA